MNKLFAIGLAILSMTSLAAAHVKWFAQPIAEAVRPYSIFDWQVILSIVLVLGIVFVGIFLEKKLRVPQSLNRFIEKFAPSALSLASIGFGLSFIIFSYNGFIFAPNLMATGSVGGMLLLLQALAGLMMLLGIYERIGGFVLVSIFGIAVFEYGFFEMMDSLEMMGFALYATIIGRPKWRIADSEILSRLTHHIHEYGLPILRVGTGLNLMVLGLSEKILAPDLTAGFLSNYDWNIMQNLGLEWYTDYWFAYSAGVAEFLFGLFFLLGLVTRLTTAFLAIFLVSTLALLGPVELVGHLPHFSIAIVLIVLGAGSRLKLLKS